jgi:nucleoside-diphosphate-sugar epimerase
MILVTGATGLVGSHLTFELILSGYRVRALKRPGSSLETIQKVFSLNSDQPADLLSKIEWVEGDILDIFSLEDAMEEVEEVYHCAALVSFLPQDKKRLMRINTEGTANVVNAALEKKIRKLCHVSSIAALGRPEHQSDLIDENLVWKTSKHNSMYAVSKYGAEREVWRGSAEGLDVMIVNPSIILGVAGPGMGSSRIFNTVWNGLKVYPPGKNGFVDVRDVVRAMILLMKSDIRNERFILNVDNIEYKKLFELMAASFGKPAPSIKVSPLISGLAWRVEKIRSIITGVKPLITRETAHTAVQQYEYSAEKIKKELGFEFTPIEETVRHFCGVFLNG